MNKLPVSEKNMEKKHLNFFFRNEKLFWFTSVEFLLQKTT